MIIKVCGMREPDNIVAVCGLPIDMVGLNFYPKSPRFVQQVASRGGNIPDYSSLPSVARSGQQKLVGIFVDDMVQNIVTRVCNYKLDFVQLHGHEGRTMIENLLATLVPDISPQVGVIKALNIGSVDDLKATEEYEGLVDYFVFDTPCENFGGSGKHFSWNLLEQYDGKTPFLLSGGIGPEDIEAIRSMQHPMMAGVDVNSKFETAPGVKDVEALRSFATLLKQS